MKPFQELGALIETRWRDANYHEQVFPTIALEALSKAKLVERVDPWEIIRWVHQTPNLPHQFDIDGRFGNPPITLYVGQRFYIDFYFWLDGTTEIHQHSFSGAFQVLLGSSIHSQFHFETQHEINPHFLLGQLETKDVKLLTKGEIQRIIAGSHYIHSLFHLDRPSATITVRSNGSPLARPQYSYKRPFVAYDPLFRNQSTTRILQTETLLYAMNHPQADDFMMDLLTRSDFHTMFLILENAFLHLKENEMTRLFALSNNKDRFAALLAQARSRHGKLVDLLPPVFSESERLMEIVKRRGTITREEHRFFLALLLNLSDRKRMLELIRARYPDNNPLDKALDWIEELYLTRVLGSSEENALGISGFDESYLIVMEGLLQGLSAGEIRSMAKSKYSDEATDAFAHKVEAISKSLKTSNLFRAILSN